MVMAKMSKEKKENKVSYKMENQLFDAANKFIESKPELDLDISKLSRMSLRLLLENEGFLPLKKR